MRWCYYEINLFGDPTVPVRGAEKPLTIDFPDGLPGSILPGVPTEITVQITDGSETYEPGSALLHYRYFGPSFIMAPLTHDSGDLYIATLPATDCAATPCFYFTAQGHLGSNVLNPSSAPSSYYSATMGTTTTIYETDFETAAGWTVQNSTGLGDGPWDRGIPVNCDRGGPTLRL